MKDISTRGYQYFAFISYQHNDEKWAKWFQKQLENYKLPSDIRNHRPDIPQYIRPVFRDKSDLCGAKLHDRQEKVLFGNVSFLPQGDESLHKGQKRRNKDYLIK